VIDPFDQDALAARLVEARQRRAVALANRSAQSAATQRGELPRTTLHTLEFTRLAKSNVGTVARSGSFDKDDFPRAVSQPAPPASSAHAEAVDRIASAVSMSSPTKMFVLIVACLLVSIGVFGAFRAFAPLGIRREVAEFISPDLRTRPETGGRITDPQRTEPVTAAESVIGPLTPAGAVLPRPFVTTNASDDEPPFSAPSPPEIPVREASPIVGAKSLVEPPGSLMVQIDPGSPPLKVNPPASSLGTRWPAGADGGGRAAPPMPFNRATPHRPEADRSPIASSMVAALPTMQHFLLSLPERSTLSVARYDEPDSVSGASASGAVGTQFHHVEHPPSSRSVTLLYQLEGSHPSSARTPPAVAKRTSKTIASTAPPESAGSPRKVSRVSSRLSAANVEAQVLRGQLERDIEAMLKTRLRDLRRR
jgi:hypothetical protein